MTTAFQQAHTHLIFRRTPRPAPRSRADSSPLTLHHSPLAPFSIATLSELNFPLTHTNHSPANTDNRYTLSTPSSRATSLPIPAREKKFLHPQTRPASLMPRAGKASIHSTAGREARASAEAAAKPAKFWRRAMPASRELKLFTPVKIGAVPLGGRYFLTNPAICRNASASACPSTITIATPSTPSTRRATPTIPFTARRRPRRALRILRDDWEMENAMKFESGEQIHGQ